MHSARSKNRQSWSRLLAHKTQLKSITYPFQQQIPIWISWVPEVNISPVRCKCYHVVVVRMPLNARDPSVEPARGLHHRPSRHLTDKLLPEALQEGRTLCDSRRRYKHEKAQAPTNYIYIYYTSLTARDSRLKSLSSGSRARQR